MNDIIIRVPDVIQEKYKNQKLIYVILHKLYLLDELFITDMITNSVYQEKCKELIDKYNIIISRISNFNIKSFYQEFQINKDPKIIELIQQNLSQKKEIAEEKKLKLYRVFNSLKEKLEVYLFKCKTDISEMKEFSENFKYYKYIYDFYIQIMDDYSFDKDLQQIKENYNMLLSMDKGTLYLNNTIFDKLIKDMDIALEKVTHYRDIIN